MKIVVPVKLSPDLVEELNIDASGKALDMTWMRLVLNELDNHAIEQAILLKEKLEAQVVVIAPDVEGAEDVLFTAAAAGADRLIRVSGLGECFNNHCLARACQPIIADLAPDLILTGVQAHDDLDGQFGPLLAENLQMHYIGYIAGMSRENGSLIMKKEFPGGLAATMKVDLPVVVGIQAAESPHRYIDFSSDRRCPGFRH
jgi:electron transfer flavoprotein beta subunit